jgi:hypothetical protein
MRSKLNELLQAWPPGTVATQAWMTEQEISPQLVRTYMKGAWIKRVGRGAYIRSGESVKWQGMVYGLQKHAHGPIWPGGATALALHGHAHYLPLGRETLWLFGAPGKRLPAWVEDTDWGVAIEYHAPNLFGPGKQKPAQLAQLDVSAGYFAGLQLSVSSMERAVFELLHYVNNEAQFTHAAEILQGLVNLRPAIMQLHLEQCRSIKTKRLVLLFGEHFQHHWYTKVNLDNVDLGSGKRQIVKSGVLNQRFEVTVPREFAGGA